MITLHLRYTIDPNKLSDIRAYVEAEMKPISESGGSIVGYYLPTDFAGATTKPSASSISRRLPNTRSTGPNWPRIRCTYSMSRPSNAAVLCCRFNGR